MKPSLRIIGISLLLAFLVFLVLECTFQSTLVEAGIQVDESFPSPQADASSQSSLMQKSGGQLIPITVTDISRNNIKQYRLLSELRLQYARLNLINNQVQASENEVGEQELEEREQSVLFDKAPITQFVTIVNAVVAAVGSFIVESRKTKHRGFSYREQGLSFAMGVTRICSVILLVICIMYAALDMYPCLYHAWSLSATVVVFQFGVLTIKTFCKPSDRDVKVALRLRIKSKWLQGKRNDERYFKAVVRWSNAVGNAQMSGEYFLSATTDDLAFSLCTILLPVPLEDVNRSFCSYTQNSLLKNQQNHLALRYLVSTQYTMVCRFFSQIQRSAVVNILDVCIQAVDMIADSSKIHYKKPLADASVLVLSVFAFTYSGWRENQFESSKNNIKLLLLKARDFHLPSEYYYVIMRAFCRLINRVCPDRYDKCVREFCADFPRYAARGCGMNINSIMVMLLEDLFEMRSE